MERFDLGTDLDSMTEEELREAARQYAHELMAKGFTPDSDENVENQITDEPVIDLLQYLDLDETPEPGQKEPELIVTKPEPIQEIEEQDMSVVLTEPVDDIEEPTVVLDASELFQKLEETAPEPTHSANEQVAIDIADTRIPAAAAPERNEKPVKPAKKRLFSRGGRKQSEGIQNLAKNVAAKSADYGLSDPDIAADGPSIDLTKLKKNDLLEIMLRQSEEIDALRAEVADLKSQLQSREIKIATSGSIAEASLKLSKIFEEAQYAADLYLANIRRETDQHDDPEFMIRGADYDE